MNGAHTKNLDVVLSSKYGTLRLTVRSALALSLCSKVGTYDDLRTGGKINDAFGDD